MSDKLLISVFAGERDSIPYRPKLAVLLDSVTTAILLQQIVYRWEKNGLRPFYKFKQPCEHQLYREGDSWCEELGFGRATFDTALSRIAIKHTSDMTVEQAIEQARLEKKPVVYWTDSGRVTHYNVDMDTLIDLLAMAYDLKTESSDSYRRKPALDKDGNRLYLKTETSFINTDTTTDTTKEEPHNPGGGQKFCVIDTLALIQEQDNTPHTEVVACCELCGEIGIKRGADSCPACSARLFWTNPMTGKLSKGDRNAIKQLRPKETQPPQDDLERRILRTLFHGASEWPEGKRGQWLRLKKKFTDQMAYLFGRLEWAERTPGVFWDAFVSACNNPENIARFCYAEETRQQQQSTPPTDPWAEWGHAPVEVDDAELAVMLEGLK